MAQGGKVFEAGRLVPLQDSRISGMLNMQELGMVGLDGFELDAEWEVDPKSIELLDKLGEGSFGTVYRARYRGTIVAVKVLSKETDVALGDFRCARGLATAPRIGFRRVDRRWARVFTVETN